MGSERQIKIIKRAKQNEVQANGLDNRRESVSGQANEKNRDAVTVVSGWIGEFRRRKTKEALRGFQSLFGSAS